MGRGDFTSSWSTTEATRNDGRVGRGCTGVADCSKPNDDVGPFAAGRGNEAGDLMLVGHLPHLAQPASWPLTGRSDAKVVAFRNAGILCLEREANAWHIRWAGPPDLVSS